jgi:hypothetical protein
MRQAAPSRSSNCPDLAHHRNRARAPAAEARVRGRSHNMAYMIVYLMS